MADIGDLDQLREKIVHDVNVQIQQDARERQKLTLGWVAAMVAIAVAALTLMFDWFTSQVADVALIELRTSHLAVQEEKLTHLSDVVTERIDSNKDLLKAELDSLVDERLDETTRLTKDLVSFAVLVSHSAFLHSPEFGGKFGSGGLANAGPVVSTLLSLKDADEIRSRDDFGLILSAIITKFYEYREDDHIDAIDEVFREELLASSVTVEFLSDHYTQQLLATNVPPTSWDQDAMRRFHAFAAANASHGYPEREVLFELLVAQKTQGFDNVTPLRVGDYWIKLGDLQPIDRANFFMELDRYTNPERLAEFVTTPELIISNVANEFIDASRENLASSLCHIDVQNEFHTYYPEAMASGDDLFDSAQLNTLHAC